MTDDDLQEVGRVVVGAAIGAVIGYAYGTKKHRVHVIDLSGTAVEEGER